MRRHKSARAMVFASLLAMASTTAPAPAQDPNFMLAPAELERYLAREPFEILGKVDNRWEGDRTKRAALRFRDGTVVPVKWARSAPGGFDLNNQPRYEVAAYRIQKLFLNEADWVVPPTAIRTIPLRVYRRLDPEVEPTFPGTASVVVVLQYWLSNSRSLDEPEPERLSDPAYLRRLGQLNILTYLIGHADSNTGNVLISTEGEPRMFAVDNGVAFNSPPSPRGTLWKDLLIDALPADAIDRLRRVRRSDLEAELAVLDQFRVGPGGRLVAEPRGPKRAPRLGVDFHEGVVQFGLTDAEVEAVWERLAVLTGMRDEG